jgi:hypothetical protein
VITKRTLKAALLALLVLACGFPAAFVAAETNTGPKLTLADTPGGPAIESMRIVIVGTEMTGQTQGYLRATAAVTGVRLFVEPIRDASTGSGLAGDVTFTANGLAQDADGFPLPDEQGNVVIRATATGISRDGSFTTRILAAMGDDVVPLGSLTIERVPAPLLRIAGSVEGAVTRKSDTPSFMQAFSVEATTSAVVEEATMSIVLHDPVGKQVTLQVDGGTAVGVKLSRISRQSPATFVLSAELDETGTYTGTIALVYADRREETRLTLDRLHAAPTIAGRDVADATGDLFVSRTYELKANLHETGGHTVALEPPKVTLQLIHEEERLQATFKSATVTQADGSTDWTLGPDEELPILITIVDLEGAGAFEGKVLLTRTGSGTVEVPFTIRQRIHFLVAVLLIALGLGASWFARERLGKRDRKDRHKQDCVRVQARLHDIDQELNPRLEERTVIEAVGDQLDQLMDDVDKDRVSDPTTQLTEIAERVDLTRPWIVHRIRMQERNVEDAVLPDLEDELQAIGDQLIAQGGAAEARKLIGMLPAAIDGVLLQRVRQRAQALQRDLTRLNTLLDGTVAKELEAELGDLIREDAMAADALEARLRRLSDRFLQALVDRHLQRLAEHQPAPPWFPADEWTTWRAESLDKARDAARIVNPVDRREAFRTAISRYLERLAQKLRDGAAAKVPSAGDKATDFEAIRDKADSALRSLQNGDLATAQGLLQQAADSYATLASTRAVRLGPPQEAGAPAAAQSMVISAAPEADLRPIDARVPVITLPNPRRRLAELERGIRDRANLLAGIVIVAGTVAGVLLLYAPDETWGSFDDLAIALLYGLGLHQVTGALDQEAIRKRLLGEPGQGTPTSP